MQCMQQTIFLVGLSGTGKSSAGPLLARSLGQRFVDTDMLIEARAGRAVTDIFASEGEPAFRALESAALREALAGPPAVVATGGGIVETPENIESLRQGIVIWLTARSSRLAERLKAHADRPLLRDDPLATLQAQAARRAARYAEVADYVVSTEHLSVDEVVGEIRRLIDRHAQTGAEQLVVYTPGGSYEVVVADGALAWLPAHIRRIAPRGRVWIVSDSDVWPLHGAGVQQLLADAGIVAASFQIPAGEASKNLSTVAPVYDWLIGNGVERGDLLLALGGGVVGDLAGFVAATVLRGIGLIQIPTTVLAVVDSSIGGKTGVDHPLGKNLIGSFYQPRLVLADTRLLQTLPPAERRAGWAEAIKHGVIADATLFADLVANADALHNLSEPWTSSLLRRAAAVKVRVVSGDEREQGERILLNLGHTIGHALEHWSEFGIRHGECVAIGMGVAAAIALRAGLCDATVGEEIDRALLTFGLPTRIPSDADPDILLRIAHGDKKVQQQRIRWVLPTAIGNATVRHDIDLDMVRAALRERMG
jgi:shikimate kinase / 3-dehydroquinate synthase